MAILNSSLLLRVGRSQVVVLCHQYKQLHSPLLSQLVKFREGGGSA